MRQNHYQNGIKEVIYDGNKYADEPAWVVSRKLFGAGGKTRQYTAKGNNANLVLAVGGLPGAGKNGC